MSNQPALSRPRAKAILGLALPIMAGMGSQNLLNLVDVAMLGRLSKEAVAAVGLCGMALWAMTALIQGLSTAIQTITARRLGEARDRCLHESAVTALYLVLLSGIPLTVILVSLAPEILSLLTDDATVRELGSDYLSIRLTTLVAIGFNFCFRGYFNGLNQAGIYVKTLVCMHLVNIIANYVLIYGKWGFPALGVRGSALGTAVATTLGCLILLFWMIRLRTPGFSLSPRGLHWQTIRQLLWLGLPSSLQNTAMSLGFLMFFHIAGKISTAALAASNILINLNLLCVLVAMGLGLATITLVSKALGEGKPEEAVAWVRGTTAIAFLSLTAVGLALVAMPHFWIGLFLPDAEVLSMAVFPLVLLGLSQIYDGVGIVLSYAHLGGGATRTVMLIAIVNQWGLFLPACWIWTHYFDAQLVHLWICMVLYRLVQCACYAISIRSRNWLSIQL